MTAAEVAAALAFPIAGPALVTTRHFAARRGVGPVAKVIASVAARRLRAQIAISRFVADRIEGSSIIVHPGVPRVDGTSAAERDHVVLVAQRLEPEKRTDHALLAWAASGLGQAAWRLQIAGEGSQARYLGELAERIGVRETVDLLGPRADVAHLMRRAALFLASASNEPFGLSVVEAMAAGLPVVAAAGGGHLETAGTVDSTALYPPDDPGAAGRLLAELAADPHRRDRYGAALQAAQREHFTVDRQVEATLDVYRSVL
jgi:glycosyltransferase involved in cell wall biosynthesis